MPDPQPPTHPPSQGLASKLMRGAVAAFNRHIIPVVAAVFLLALIGMFWHLHALSGAFIRSNAIKDASHFTKALSEVRTLYTKRVVGAAEQHGMTITHDYESRPGAIPLPATFSMELAERIGQASPGTKVRLYSDYPFPWREDGGPHDRFENDALTELRNNPEQPFWRFEDIDGRPSLRYSVADRMRASCIDCHNTHPDSPKTDWQVGDVRGVIEVAYPLDDAIAQTRADLRDTFLFTLAVSVAGIVVLGLATRRNRKAGEAVQQANARLAGSNKQLEHQTHDLRAQQEQIEQAYESLDQKNEQLAAANTSAETANLMLQEHSNDLERARIAAMNMMQDMSAAREQAEAANMSKSNFLANMSHEIRTPMTAILGYADLLHDDTVSPDDHRNYIHTIKRNGEHLLAIINDILDLSKIEAGKMTIESISCSPAQVVTDVAGLMRARIEAKGLTYQTQYDGKIPRMIRTDPTRLRQVLVNLMGNAVKFTERGSIRLRVAMDTQNTAEPPRLRFDVIDTGLGISKEQQEKLFRPFTQADTSTTRKFGGTGLGLTISKCLTELLGGELAVHSATGEGSTFSFTIATGDLAGTDMHDGGESTQPLDRTVIMSNTPQKSLDETRILLAEDGPDNQRLISFHLKKAGAAVTVAENGLRAYELASRAAEQGTPFDVIFMDMQMPELDGYSATRKLRNEGYTGPIIALTAHAMASDRAKCIDAGCDEYTTKPINSKVLVGLAVRFAFGDQPHQPDPQDLSANGATQAPPEND